MNQFKLKIRHKGATEYYHWLVSYKITKAGECKINLSVDEDDASLFDEDDMILDKCKEIFKDDVALISS